MAYYSTTTTTIGVVLRGLGIRKGARSTRLDEYIGNTLVIYVHASAAREERRDEKKEREESREGMLLLRGEVWLR